MNYTVICNQEYLRVPANYIIFLDTAIPFFCQVKSLRLFSSRSWTEFWSYIWILMFPKRLQTKFLSRTILCTWIDQFSKSRSDQFPEFIFLLENSLRFRFHERNNQVSQHKFSGSAGQKKHNCILDTILLVHEDYSSHVYTQLKSFNISIPKFDSTNDQKYPYIRQDTLELIVNHHQITRRLKACESSWQEQKTKLNKCLTLVKYLLNRAE